jgi:hypothetical protein
MPTLSQVAWDRIRTATGFSRAQIDDLRADNGSDQRTSCSDRDVVETVALQDLEWSDSATIANLRDSLQKYITVLRALKAENKTKAGSRIHARNYVDDARYASLRQKEASHRLTSAKIAGMFKNLALEECGVSDLDAPEFSAVEDLRVSRNNIPAIRVIPPAVRVLAAAASGIQQVHLGGVKQHNLLFVTLAANRIVSLAFLVDLPSIVILDASFNAIADLDDVVTMLDATPSLTEVDLRGNPVCFVEGYRRRLCSAVPTIRVLDGEPVSDADRAAPIRENPSRRTFATNATISVTVTGIKDLALALSSGEQDETAATAAASAAAALGPGGKKLGAGKPDPKSKKGGKEATLDQTVQLQSATKRTLTLSCEWCDGRVACDDVAAVVAALSEADAVPEARAAKGGSKGEKKAVTVAAPGVAFAAPSDAADGGISSDEKTKSTLVSSQWSIGGVALPVAADLARPCTFVLKATESTVASDVASADAGSTSALATKQFVVGELAVDFSSLATQAVLTPSPPSESIVLRCVGTASLEVDAGALRERKYSISILKKEVAKMQARESEIERTIAELLRSPSPAGDANEVSVSVTLNQSVKPGVKKAPVPVPKGGKSATPNTAVSEDVKHAQEQLAAARAQREERQGALAAEERSLAAHIACSGIELTAVCTITCLGPDAPKPEPDALSTTQTLATKELPKKGKK